MSIDYTLSITNANAHLIDVHLHVSSPDPQGQTLQLPNWIPGSYMIRDFSRNIVAIAAQSDGADVGLEKIDKSTWRAPAGLKELSVSYRVYAWELSVRAAHVDDSHAFFNGTSVFLSVAGAQSQAHRVLLQRPEHDLECLFEVATTLPVIEVDSAGFGWYQAADYDELIDHPVEMGTFKRLVYEASGVQHEVILTGVSEFDEQRVISDLQRICNYEIGFFGAPAPYQRYLFLVMVVDTGYGGLEHRSSTALMITRENLPAEASADVSDKYLDFLGLCSHEYFHNWNVKRIKPARFAPYQLQSETYTELLWFFEGITSYYDDLILVRSGLIGKKRYLDVLSKTLTRVQRGAGRLTQSVTDSSFDAWHKFYKQDENAPNAIVSYYAKGALLALCLDSLLRQHSANKLSLDDLMLALWRRWLDTGAGLQEQEIQETVTSLLGHNELDDFFHSALYSTADLPLESALHQLGVKLEWRARVSADDAGGVIKATGANAAVAATPWLGATVQDAPGGVKILQVMTGSPAERAGLAASDLLIAMADLSVSKGKIDSYLQRFSGQSSVSVHFFRLGRLKQSEFALEAAPKDTAMLEIVDDKAAQDWLTGDSHGTEQTSA